MNVQEVKDALNEVLTSELVQDLFTNDRDYEVSWVFATDSGLIKKIIVELKKKTGENT